MRGTALRVVGLSGDRFVLAETGLRPGQLDEQHARSEGNAVRLIGIEGDGDIDFAPESLATNGLSGQEIEPVTGSPRSKHHGSVSTG